LENFLLKKKGQAFEDFFSDIAKQTWAENFEIWKPQGPLGDFKCDGYQVQEKTVFQCYGPEIPEPSKTAAKIRADFEGAKKHSAIEWQNGFSSTINAICRRLAENYSVNYVRKIQT
jgi:hypothetical protein